MSIEGQYIYRDEQDSVTVRDRSTLELANSTIGGKLIYSVRRLRPTDCRIWKEGLEEHGISTRPNSFPGLNTFTFSSSNGCYVTRLVYVGFQLGVSSLSSIQSRRFSPAFLIRNCSQQPSRSYSQQLDASFHLKQLHSCLRAKLVTRVICLAMNITYGRIRVVHDGGSS
jgi:hypothetical protein